MPDGRFLEVGLRGREWGYCGIFGRILFQMEAELDIADSCHVFGLWEARVGVVGAAVVDFAGLIGAKLRWLG